jgi:hypothetical protein
MNRSKYSPVASTCQDCLIDTIIALRQLFLKAVREIQEGKDPATGTRFRRQ